MATLHLCGAGNSEGVRLALRVNASESRWDRIVLLDDDPTTHGSQLLGVPVIGPFDALADADPAADATVNLVARTTAGRRRAGERIDSFGLPRAGLVSPDVDLLGVSLAPDVLVYPRATLGPESRIEAGSVVFMGAVVGHEARVGAGCVVAANAVLNARVQLAEGVYVGSGSSILPEIRVGAGATVGAASAVLDHVAPGETVLGVPARPLSGGGSESPARPASGPSASEAEAWLVRAWGEVLDRTVDPTVGVFDQGATSLDALRVCERLRSTTALTVAPVDLFRYPTLRGLAGFLGRARPASPNTGPAGGREKAGPVAETVAPAEGLAEAVVSVFREVLGVPDVGPESNFFDLGGDTGSAQEACRALQRITGEPLCFVQVARFPTARELSRHLELAAGQPPSCPAQGVTTRLIHRHSAGRV